MTEARARARRWRAANRERYRHYRVANQEKICEAKRHRRAANPEKHREQDRARRATNPEKLRELNDMYRARKLGLLGSITPGYRTKLYRLQDGKCFHCKRPLPDGAGTQLDHLRPYKMVPPGLHEDRNIALACIDCNLRPMEDLSPGPLALLSEDIWGV